MRFREFVLTESKQNIVSIGFPEVIASVLYERIGKHAFLIAKWFKEYNSWRSRAEDKEWWNVAAREKRLNSPISLATLTDLYAATKDEDSYNQILDQLGFENDGYHNLEEDRVNWKNEIEEELFKNVLFSKTIVQDIMSGKLKNVSPYKKLNVEQAVEKYDQKNVFQDTQPIKQYPNGLRWIDVGKKCELVGKQMKNCGSAGLMSMDKDRTMIALFDKSNNSHIVVTYSPNERRISGDQGGASSEPKEKYHDYILDLAKHLGATFDADKSKSTLLKMKSLFGPDAQVQRVGKHDTYNQFFKFNRNGQEYYSNGSKMVSADDFARSQAALAQAGQPNDINRVFSHQNPNTANAKFSLVNRFSLQSPNLS